MSVIFFANKMIFQQFWCFHRQNLFSWGNHGNLKGLHCTLHHSQHPDGMILQNIPAIDKHRQNFTVSLFPSQLRLSIFQNPHRGGGETGSEGLNGEKMRLTVETLLRSCVSARVVWTRPPRRGSRTDGTRRDQTDSTDPNSPFTAFFFFVPACFSPDRQAEPLDGVNRVNFQIRRKEMLKKQLFSMQSCKELSCNQYVGSRWTQCLSQESVPTQTGCDVMLNQSVKNFLCCKKTLLKMSFRGEKSLCGVFFKTTSCYVSTSEVLWSCLEPYIKHTNTQTLTCVVSCSASSNSYRFLLLQSLSALLHLYLFPSRLFPPPHTRAEEMMMMMMQHTQIQVFLFVSALPGRQQKVEGSWSAAANGTWCQRFIFRT